MNPSLFFLPFNSPKNSCRITFSGWVAKLGTGDAKLKYVIIFNLILIIPTLTQKSRNAG